MVHTIVGAASLKLAGQAGRLETQGRADDVAQIQSFLEAEVSLPQGTSVFSSEGLQLIE